MELIFLAAILLCSGIIYSLYKELKTLRESQQNITRASIQREEQLKAIKLQFEASLAEAANIKKELEDSNVKNASILSQKKSSETKLGQIGEQLAPFLEGFNYDSKNCRFLGSPLDFIIFDTDSADPSIVFVEVKTGNSTLSKKQKQLKSLVRSGRVRFEEYRISGKGTKMKVTKNEEE